MFKGFGRNNKRLSDDYLLYMNSDLWKRLRDRIIRERVTCERCGHNRGGLHVHHITYERLGYELDSDLQVLCRCCHRIVHYQKNKERRKF